jgi:tetratricopeptide (TPR) repeat protein
VSFLAGGELLGSRVETRVQAPGATIQASTHNATAPLLGLEGVPASVPPAGTSRKAVAERPQASPRAQLAVSKTPLAGLWAQLADLDARGGVDAMTRRTFVQILVMRLLDLSDPLAARAALETVGGGLAEYASLGLRIADTLVAEGFRDEGLDLYLELFDMAPGRYSVSIYRAIQIAPDLALEAIRAHLEMAAGGLRTRLRTDEAAALIALGSADEARLILDELIAEDPSDTRALATLRSIDPARADEKFRELVAEDPLFWAIEYAAILDEDEDTEAAVGVLLQGLAVAPRDEDLIDALAFTSPMAAFDHLSAYGPPDAGPDVLAWYWEETGELLEARGFHPEALSALRSAVLTGDNGVYPGIDSLIDLDPSIAV